MDQESVVVMLCVFFKFQMLFNRVVLFAYFLLLNDYLWPLKRFLTSLSHSYVGSSREVRGVNFSLVNEGSCSAAPLKGADGLGLAVAVFLGLSDVFERSFYVCSAAVANFDTVAV